MESPTLDLTLFRNFGIALLIGALVGIDREKKKSEEGDISLGGIRTFVLFAEAGAVAAWLSQSLASSWILAATLLGVAIYVTAAYLRHTHSDPNSLGLTTEIASLVVCLLGAAVMVAQVEVAVALAIATSATLAYKEPLHGVVDKVSREDIFAGLKLLIATFIILPLLPDRTVDPLEAVNPYRVWFLVILIAGLSLIGYVLIRWLGTHRGTALTGLTGGLVSSTAVTLSFARSSLNEKLQVPMANALACGVLVAWAVMFVRVLVEVAVVYAPLLRYLAAPILLLAGVTVAAASWFYFRGHRAPQEDEPPEYVVAVKNPFSLYSASKFALLFLVVQVLVKLAQEYLPASSLYFVATLAGLTDVDAITLSMAQYAQRGGSAPVAVIAILIAALTNTAVKCGLLMGLAAGLLWRRIMLSTIAILVTGGLAIAATVLWLQFGSLNP